MRWFTGKTQAEFDAEKAVAEAAAKAAKEVADKAAYDARWGRVKNEKDGVSAETRVRIAKERAEREAKLKADPNYLKAEQERLKAQQAEQARLKALQAEQQKEKDRVATIKLKKIPEQYQQLQVEREKRQVEAAKIDAQKKQQYEADVEKTHQALRAAKIKPFAMHIPNGRSVVAPKDESLASGSFCPEVQEVRKKMEEARRYERYKGVMGLFKNPRSKEKHVDPTAATLEATIDLRK